MHKFLIGFVAFGAFVFTGANTNAAPAKQTLVLNTTSTSIPLSNAQGTGVSDVLVAEVFKRLNVGFKIAPMPAERALINANKGIDDGTFLRVSGMDIKYQNLVKVPESFLDYEFVAISKNQNIPIKGWESLRGHSLGIITGWKIVELKTKTIKEVTAVQNVKQLFRLLELDHSEVVIVEKRRAMVALQQTPIDGAVILHPPMETKPVFLYLNTKHKHLVSKIAAVLRAMKLDGTHGRLMKRAMKPYVKSE